jgi:hypothetical protein
MNGGRYLEEFFILLMLQKLESLLKNMSTLICPRMSFPYMYNTLLKGECWNVTKLLSFLSK